MADEVVPDWRLLAPHRPIAPGDDAYVDRPTGGGDAIAAWINAGGSTVLVSGPAGVGKSTELARAAQSLTSTRVACLVQLDRMTNMHRLSAEECLALIAKGVVETGLQQGLPLSHELSSAVLRFVDNPPSLFRASSSSLLQAALDEVIRVSPHGRVALLLDGLEKVPPHNTEIFAALSDIPELADLILVIPWHAAFSGGVEPILRAGERLHRVAALETKGAAATDAREFFTRILVHRLRGADIIGAGMLPSIERAFVSSGGIPRIFLQLMADAGTYARVKRGAAWPDMSDLDEATFDQQDSFRRALLPGDTEAIQHVFGTDGRELDLGRRVRLLAQGVLLERFRAGRVSLEVHPLALLALKQP